MKSLNQFNELSNQELMEINGGAGLDSLIGTLNSLLQPTLGAVNTSLLILTAGTTQAVNTIAGGLSAFLSKLSLPSL